MRELFAVVVLVAACGAPAPAPAEPAAPADPDAPVIHTWIVEKHILVKGASVSDEDAQGFYGRTIDVSAKGFLSPWQGTCEDASRTKRPRQRKGVMLELEVPPDKRETVTAFGFDEELTEYRLTCNDRRKPPPLTLYVSNEKAMTCFGGACYLMKQF